MTNDERPFGWQRIALEALLAPPSWALARGRLEATRVGEPAPWDAPDADPLGDLERAVQLVRDAPYQPSPPVCRSCTLVADTAGGPVFACESGPGCAIDAALEADR